MLCVHYKFSSKLESNTVTFDGLHITLTELKKQIMTQEHLKATDCDLQITNAQTREEYLDDEVHIPMDSSVIVRRTPVGGVKPARRTFIVHRSLSDMLRSSRPTDSSPMTLAQLTKIQKQDAEAFKPVKTTSKGIPQSFMVKAEPGTKGAMLTMTGEHAIPVINAQAYAQGKKERPPFVPHESSSSKDNNDLVPDELLCSICTRLMIDAVKTPCCGNSYCNECIQTTLLDSEDHVCFRCKQSDVSPDHLIANNFLRQAVNDYKNESGYTVHKRAPVHHPAPPQLSRPLHSRQQDPLKVNVPQTSASKPPVTVTTTSSPSQIPNTNPTPVAPPSPDALEEGEFASPAPPVDQNSSVLSSSQGEQLPHGDTDPKPVAKRESSGCSGRSSQSYGLPFINQPPSKKPAYSSGHQSRPNHSHGGGGNRHWYRNRAEHDSSHLQPAQPPAPVPPVYPAPALYGPPPQPYFPPYTSGPGIIPPPIINYQPQSVCPSGHPVLNPPWAAPGSQPPLLPLPRPLPQPSISKEDFYRPRHHRMEKRSPYTRSRTRSRSRSRSKSYAYRRTGSPQSPFSYRGGDWEGAEVAGPYRSHHSPIAYRAPSPDRRKPPPRELPPYERKGQSPGSQDRWEREWYRQWEKEYADKKYYKDYDNQQPSVRHRGHSSRHRERDRMSPLPRNRSVYERVRRRDKADRRDGRVTTAAPHPPSSS